MGIRRKRVKWGPHGTRSRTSDAYWKQPLKWNREAAASHRNWEFAISTARSEYDSVEPYTRPRVFCASLADIFEDWEGPIVNAKGEKLYKSVAFSSTTEKFRMTGERRHPLSMSDLRRDLFALIDQTPHLNWLLLTKRPENVRRMWDYSRNKNSRVSQNEGDNIDVFRPNVWLGCSVSDQPTADKYVPELLKLRDLCPVLFLSAEPLLGAINLDANYLGIRPWSDEPTMGVIGWVILGGESGSKARPCNLSWIRSLVEQCSAADVPCFVKQWGSRPFIDTTGGERYDDHTFHKLSDPKGSDPEEWPQDIRVREFPKADRMDDPATQEAAKAEVVSLGRMDEASFVDQTREKAERIERGEEG